MEAINGNCGLVVLTRHQNVQLQQDLGLLSHEETVESEQKIRHESVSDILTNLDPIFENVIFLEKISIMREQVHHIEIITRNQSINQLRFKFRQGRITESIFKESACKVSDDQKILNPLKLEIATTTTTKIVNLKNHISNLKQQNGV